jgi:hypothetical protein
LARSQQPAAHILHLPPELLLYIIAFLPQRRDLAALLRTCTTLAGSPFGEELYRRAETQDVEHMLYWAVLKHCVALAERAIMYGAYVDAPVPVTRETPLMVAARQGDVGLMRLLVGRGADVNNPFSMDGSTALLLATRMVHEEGVRFLVESGADVKVRNRMGETALRHVVEAGHVGLARWFLGMKKVDVDAVCVSKMTPVMVAMRRGDGRMVRLLLEHGARMYTCAREDRLPSK